MELSSKAQGAATGMFSKGRRLAAVAHFCNPSAPAAQAACAPRHPGCPPASGTAQHGSASEHSCEPESDTKGQPLPQGQPAGGGFLVHRARTAPQLSNRTQAKGACLGVQERDVVDQCIHAAQPACARQQQAVPGAARRPQGEEVRQGSVSRSSWQRTRGKATDRRGPGGHLKASHQGSESMPSAPRAKVAQRGMRLGQRSALPGVPLVQDHLCIRKKAWGWRGKRRHARQGHARAKCRGSRQHVLAATTQCSNFKHAHRFPGDGLELSCIGSECLVAGHHHVRLGHLCKVRGRLNCLSI